jgi:hypothetical protein
MLQEAVDGEEEGSTVVNLNSFFGKKPRLDPSSPRKSQNSSTCTKGN